MFPKLRPIWLVSALATIVILGSAAVIVIRSAPASDREEGMASVYSDALHGRKTASGEPYDRAKLTAAHRTLPFGTRIRVTSAKTKQTVEVRVNDRGPFHKGWVVDLSREAAARLGLKGNVVTKVTVDILAPMKIAER